MKKKDKKEKKVKSIDVPHLRIEPEDYFIVNHKGKNRLCIKLAGGHRGVLENTMMLDEPETITYEPEQVVCNLGKNPKPDTYGKVKVRPYIKTIESKRFGPIHVCTKVDKKGLTALSKAMHFVADWYEKHATLAFLPLHAVYLYPTHGKYAGMYYAKSKGVDITDEIHLFPKTFEDVDYNKYVIAHEFAHGLFHRCVPKDIRTRWLRLYQKRLKLSKVKQKQLEDLWESVSAYDGGLSAYKKEIADDQDSLILKEVLGYFRRNHRMSEQDMDMMLTHDSESLQELWPSAAVLTEERPDISEYSLKNYHEFFAEAIAYHISGKKVPKDVLNGIEYTLKHCKRALRDN